MKTGLDICVVVLSGLAMPLVWAQTPAPAKVADSRVAECRSNNAKAHDEVRKMFAEARKDRKIDPAERRKFDSMEERLSRHQSGMSRDGLTLAECQQIGKEIAAEKAAVAKMAASDRGAPKDDAQVAACRNDNAKAHDEIIKILADARKRGAIDQAESRKFDKMERDFKVRQSQLGRDGLTLKECQQLGKDIAAERVAVQKMAASKQDPRIAECRNDNARARDEVRKMFAEARKDRKIDPAEFRKFDSMEERLSRRQSGISQDGLTLAECRQIGKEIAAERAAVAKMAASDRGK